MTDNVISFPDRTNNDPHDILAHVLDLQLQDFVALTQFSVQDIEHRLSEHDGDTIEQRQTMRNIRRYIMASTIALLQGPQALPPRGEEYIALFDNHTKVPELAALGADHMASIAFNFSTAMANLKAELADSQCQH